MRLVSRNIDPILRYISQLVDLATVLGTRTFLCIMYELSLDINVSRCFIVVGLSLNFLRLFFL